MANKTKAKAITSEDTQVECTPVETQGGKRTKRITPEAVQNNISNMRKAIGKEDHEWGASAMDRLARSAKTVSISLVLPKDYLGRLADDGFDVAAHDNVKPLPSKK